MANIAGIGKALKTTAEIIGAVTTVVGAAGSLQEAVQPAMDSDDTKAALAKGKKAFDGLLQKAAGAKESVGAIASKAASAKETFDDVQQAKKEKKELAKQLKQARQVVLESASQSVTYKEFARHRGTAGAAATALTAGLYSGAGCFVFATYSALDFDNDLTDYSYAYVGKGAVLGEAIEHASSRGGDPDVYADVKYKQNVHVYSYACAPTELEDKYNALCALFAPEEDER